MKYFKSLLHVAIYLAVVVALHSMTQYFFYKSLLHEIESFAAVIDANPHIHNAIAFILMFIALAIIARLLNKESIVQYCGIRKISPDQVTLMVIIGFFAFVFNTSLTNISVIDQHFPQFELFLSYNYEDSLIIFGFISSVLIGPVFEEFLFRGLIYNTLRKSLPTLPSVIIASALYGVLFLDFALWLFCFVAALMYSFIYVKSQNLLPIIVLQITATALVLFSRRMGIETMIDSWGDLIIVPIFASSITIVIFCCYLFARSLQKKHGSEITTIEQLNY